MSVSDTYTREELASLCGYVGEGVRVSRAVRFYGISYLSLGDHCRIDDGCILTGTVYIGKRVHLAPYCLLYGKAGITIGDYSGFGAFTAMHSESDDYSGASMFGPQVPEAYQPRKQRAAIVIGQHVLGGTRTTLLPGVRLGDGVSIGAHSLVNRSVEPWTIVAGTPARRLADRCTDLLRLCREFEADSGEPG